MGDLDTMSSGAQQPAGKNKPRTAAPSWEDEMAEMDRFLDEAGAGDG